MGTQKTPLQRTSEINVGQDSIDADFLGANRQFDWIELSLVYDKSDKHKTIYDSYNHELAAKRMKSVEISNFTELYSLTNEKKYDVDNLTQRHFLYKQLVAWSCGGSSVGPLSGYMNNPIFQELVNEDEYFDVKSNERMYLDLRGSSGYVK